MLVPCHCPISGTVWDWGKPCSISGAVRVGTEHSHSKSVLLSPGEKGCMAHRHLP